MTQYARLTIVSMLLLAAGCSGGGTTVTADVGVDVPGTAETLVEPDVVLPEVVFDVPVAPDVLDVGGEAEATSECPPGKGCFLDPCESNDDCLSGWCVGHMGEDVCTQQCQTECPQGWSCEQVPGTAPDVVWICVSQHANLCLPCGSAADCKGAAGVDDACLDYGEQGSFCGGKCSDDKECPWGFSCAQAVTVDGAQLLQCVAVAGICPCTKKAVELGLATPCERESEFGTCDGKRVCTAEGLSECSAPEPVEESCNDSDDDCDGQVDEDTCDDGNECTDDSCLGKDGCEHLPLNAIECMDGDPCTAADHCESGVCVGDAVECDDDNPCTEDLCTPTGGCDHPPQFGPCDDGDPCTAGDLCSEGKCGGTPVSCSCKTDKDCAALEDGDLCNGTLVCDTGKLPYQCAVDPETVVECPLPPAGPHEPCLKAACNPTNGGCSLDPVNEGKPCSDGNACTLSDSCGDGKCTGGPAANCNDGNPCTDDSCDPVEGCLHKPNSNPCNDGNACTVGDACLDGSCNPGQALLPCNDGNPCTDDSCQAASGCTHTPNSAPCNDGNACTQDDVCKDGSCTFGSFVTCNDGNPCTQDACAPESGCVFTMSDAPCNDGSICTVGDHCHLGQCIGSSALVCSDGNPCTDDACDPKVGCTFVFNTAACDDGSACTTGDQCSKGWCGGKPLPCDDANPCTDDSCAPATGCVHTPNQKGCDDSSLCTLGDFCDKGVCQPGLTPLACNDANLCTDDSCDPKTGCKFSPNTLLCDDGSVCTVGDVCAGGTCKPGTALPCADSNVCTDDSCDPVTGCKHVNNAASCVDQDLCTINEVCSGGACVKDQLDCGDKETCTTDSCDPAQGCKHVPLPDDSNCGQNKWCKAGVCVDKPQQPVTLDTLNFNGMTGWPLKFDGTPYCKPTTDQEQMDALCKLAGYTKAQSWTTASKSINNCYCWGACSGFQWQSNCCSGWQTQIMVTSVTCI